MNRFTPHEHDVRENQIYRDTLLAQPVEFFRACFGGQEPSLSERLFLVERLIQAAGAAKVFMNDTYTVKVRPHPPFVQLDISRHDNQPVRSWRDLQQIKNELVGPECEAVELFPAESRLVDTANQYHLWVNPQAGHRFPMGFQRRIVLEKPIEAYQGLPHRQD